MIGLFAPDDVRAMDQRAFDRGVHPLTLMERAASHLLRGILEVGGRGYGLRVGLLCGKGNNGGDGLAAARRLLDVGACPLVCLVAGADDLSDDAAVQLPRWRAAGGRVTDSVAAALEDADVGVD
ncbi:MAG: bifunctional ADP-dependent NAD(P)H-hydrate dehydratase/NAD(P)H-hydrate epimerase, partial [Actinomycetota bacterium]|nr:bifunctional ADP-dependent NAD(P)H-hydrate dehydratase/NAD(P)H-hydrate epimerase [Actinomycetota bacterium]